MPKVRAAMKAFIEKNETYLVVEMLCNGKIYTDFPGGKIEYGEEPLTTLQREVFEEVALEIEILEPLGVWWFYRDDKDQVVCSTYRAKPLTENVDLSLNPADENITGYRWLTKNELLEVSNFPDESVKTIIKAFL